jgi:hypothetical protein
MSAGAASAKRMTMIPMIIRSDDSGLMLASLMTFAHLVAATICLSRREVL